MNTTQISLDTFKNILRKDVETLCREEGLNYDKETDRGYAFQKWCANLLIRRDGLSVDDVLTFASNDFKIDVVLEDADARRLYLIQSKYPSPASSPPVLEDEVITFFDRHEILQKEPEYVRTHANDALLEYIADYSNRLEDGWLLYWYFITTGRASEKIADLCIAKDSAAKQEYANVGFRLIDLSVLKELYIQSQTLEQSIPEQTQFHLRKQSWIIKRAHYRTLVAIVRGTTLAGLYKKERERIFAYNIRSYLGKNQLNKEIIKTAISAPEAFFYFNNGVSAICTSFSIDEQSGEFVGQNFQIINGAQTVGALSSISGLSSDVEILLRVTEAGSVKTEKGFNADIIRYNNTQNIVKLSDFRSNDQIHLWLQNRFSSLRTKGAVDAKIAYERKRSFRRIQKTYVITLEEFAKVRFGYLYEPTRCVADPKSLWTHQQDGGCYEQAFGVDGSLRDFWPDDIFDETLLIVIIYKKIEEQIDQSIKRDRKFLWLRRLRYFGLALSAEHIRIKKVDRSQLRDSKKSFESWFDTFWRDCLRALIDAYQQAFYNDKVTVFALARSEQRWSQVKAKYSTYLELEF